jgi:hypothetical protein
MPRRLAPEPPLKAAGGGKRAKTTTKKPAGADAEAAEPEPEHEQELSATAGAKAKSKAKSKAGNFERAKTKLNQLNKKNKNDNFVQAMTKQYIGELPEEMQNQLLETLKSRAWTTSGACSGTGMAELALHEVMSWASADVSVDFICEKVKGKRVFLNNIVLPHCDASQSCLFEDLLELPTGSGQCALHGGTAENNDMCRVPCLSDFFTCGFSCKDLSKLNGQYSAEERSNILSLGLGTSGGTFKAVIGHAARAKPSVIILENVDEMTKPDSPNVRYLWTAFENVGYGGSSKCFSTADYHLPQRRTRVFFVMLNCEAFGYTLDEAGSTAATMLNTTELFKCKSAPTLKEFLLPDSSPRVVAELGRRLANIESRPQNKTYGPQSWQQHHAAFLSAKGFTWQQVLPPAATRDSEWYKLLPAREKDVLGFTLCDRPQVC